MSTLFDVTLESNVLTGTSDSFTSAVTNGGDLSVTPAAAMGFGNYGLQCVIDGSTNILYGQKTQTAPGSDEIRFRFYIDPNTLTMANGDVFNICDLRSSGPVVLIVRIMLRYTVAAGYQIQGRAYNDAGLISTDTTNVTDAEHYIEYHVERASSNVAADGRVRMWIDGILVKTWSNVDNWDTFANMTLFRLGALAALDAGTSGTLYLDELRANDDGSEIGPSIRPDLQLLIDGVDHISELIHESLVVSQLANRLNSTCSFDLIVTGVIDKDAWTVGVTRVEDGDVITGHTVFSSPKVEVSITDGATVYFAGILSKITVKPKGVVTKGVYLEPDRQVITCHCHDFSSILEESIVDSYERYATKTDEEIIDDIFGKYVTGIDFAAHVAGGAYTFNVVSFENITVREVMDTIVSYTGYEWYIDYDKNLHYSETGDAAPGWHLSDVPDDVDSFPYLDPIATETDATNLVNRVFIVGSSESAWFQDATSIAEYGTHQAIVTDTSLTVTADLAVRGDAILDAFKDPVVTYTVRIQKGGLRAGMEVRLVCAHLDVDASFPLRKMTVKFPADGDPVYRLTLGGLDYSAGAPLPPPLLALGATGWSHTIGFAATDLNTVIWLNGVITTAEGQVFNIVTGTTGNMAARTLVYLDIDVSTTILQTTTVASVALGDHKLIIADCWPGAILAGFQVFGATTTDDPIGINAEVVGAGTIGPTEIVGSKLSDIYVDMGIITAGEFRAYTGTWNVDADGFRLNATEFAGQENGVDQVVILAADGKLKAGAGAVVLDEDGLRIISNAPAGIPEQIRFRYDDAGTERSMGQVYSDWAGGAAQMLTWLTSRREVGSPWPANISTVVAAIDAIAGTDVRLAVSSGGVVDVTGEDIFRVDKLLRPGTIANAAAEAALAGVEDGCLIYRLDTDKLRLRANGAWVDIN